IVQEALTNIRKHAVGARALVEIRYSAGAVEIEVTDTGPAIEAPGSVPREGLGLVGITERAALFGGEAEAGPTPEGGFRVRARLSKSPKIVVLTTFDYDEYVYEALKAGASAFLLKDSPQEQLVAAVRVVSAGDALLHPSITRRLIEDFAARPTPRSGRPPELEHLSDREIEVMKLVARGLSNEEIGLKLFLAKDTVKTHVGHVLTKLSLRDRAQIIVMAYETGLVQPGRE